jgi:hypothetical protein
MCMHAALAKLTGPNADASWGAPVAQAATNLQAAASNQAEARQACGAAAAARCCHRAAVVCGVLWCSRAWPRAACRRCGEGFSMLCRSMYLSETAATHVLQFEKQ